MKKQSYLLKILLAVILVNATLASCRKNDDPEYEFFVSNQLEASFTKSYITGVLSYAASSYPVISDLQDFINDGVNVYQLEYNTQVNGEKIIASGLVAVPSTPGEYPVLSFQNGTNTKDSNCPSNNPMSLDYQFIEFIASMGFIVTIPDYPGFGSSAQIPHPYLVTDPTVHSIVDMFRAVGESVSAEFPGIKIMNEYYLLGYSQGGWATMALHKAMETQYLYEFDLIGSVCGAGPYDMYKMFQGISTLSTYPMPSYICYIINAYSHYLQFNNKISDILNEPYASGVATLYNGELSLSEINNQLTTSIPGLFKQEFIAGFQGAAAYSTVRQGLVRNSIPPWNTQKHLLLVHGAGDTHVNVSSTESMYTEMVNTGTSTALIKKIIFPGLDHGDAVIPCMVEGLKFLISLRDNRLS